MDSHTVQFRWFFDFTPHFRYSCFTFKKMKIDANDDVIQKLSKILQIA